ncbi:hypothetical protein [Rhodopseudomonas sp. RCAM05734]|uniref:hypothetical protein n=1 Tax=Rhodopseudomonas sp. RCAM05734 TaxID=3457549 RepID=UPI004043E39D
MTEAQIKYLVDRFLNWRLPRDFNPDAGISYSPPLRAIAGPSDSEMPSGTNLFGASQADQMVRHMIEGMPVAPAEQAMSDKEAVDMMRRCKEEIVSLRATIDLLNPKADAYDKLAIVLGLLPRASMGMGENIVWTIDKRIRELTPKTAAGVSE